MSAIPSRADIEWRIRHVSNGPNNGRTRTVIGSVSSAYTTDATQLLKCLNGQFPGKFIRRKFATKRGSLPREQGGEVSGAGSLRLLAQRCERDPAQRERWNASREGSYLTNDAIHEDTRWPPRHDV